MCGCEFIPARRALCLYRPSIACIFILLCSSGLHCRSCSNSLTHAAILICSRFVRPRCICVRVRTRGSRECKQRECLLMFTSSSYWTIKAGSVDDSVQSQAALCRFVAPFQQYIWSCSTQITGRVADC